MNRVTLKKVLLGITFLIIDGAVYILLGLLLMNYDDFYDPSRGEYWSLESMSLSEKITYIGLNVWHGINILILLFLCYKTFFIIRKKIVL